MGDPRLLLVAVLATGATARAQLTVTTTSVPTGAYDVPYSFTLQAMGGVPPYQWCGPPQTPGALCPWGTFSTAAGGLPPGIVLSADGVLGGTPGCAGSYPFNVQVQDSAGSQQTSTFLTLSIPATGPLLVATNTPPAAFLQITYNFNLCAAGGMLPYSHDPVSNPSSTAGWSVLDTEQLPLNSVDASVDLGPMPPAGLTLDLGGKLWGTPSEAGKYTLSVQVIDTTTPPQVATKVLPLIILPAANLNVLNPTPPTATVGIAYTAQVQSSWLDVDPATFMPVDASGQATPAAAALLPPGITLSSTGLLSGVPTTAGSFSFQVQLTDQIGGVVVDQTIQLAVAPATANAPLEPSPTGGCATTSGTSSGAGLLAVLVLAVSRRRRRS